MRRKRVAVWIVSLIGLAVVAWTIASFAVIWSVEQAPYRVVATYDGFEVRAYDRLVLAETVAGAPGNASDSTAFRRLARYIFGGNAEGRDIAMTAPVLIDDTEGRTRMSFVLPRDVQPEGAPPPRQDDVTVKTQEPQRFAATRFSWFAPRSRRETLGAKLLANVKAAGLTPAGSPIYAAYNPPMSIPFVRRHEMLVRLAGASD